jgi:hypothetical protein
MIWPSLNRLVFITPKIKIYPFHCFRLSGGIQYVMLPEFRTKGLVKFQTSEILPLLVILLTIEFELITPLNSLKMNTYPTGRRRPGGMGVRRDVSFGLILCLLVGFHGSVVPGVWRSP